eukprot:jgi/Galph1/177/GphlegSOOS_G5012.1
MWQNISKLYTIPYNSRYSLRSIIISLSQYKGQINRGARARNLFSSERTFNSWLRAGLAAVAFGATAAKYLKTVYGRIGGILLFVLGVFIIVYCVGRHYFSVFQIEEDNLYSISIVPLGFSILAVMLAITTFVLLMLDDSIL